MCSALFCDRGTERGVSFLHLHLGSFQHEAARLVMLAFHVTLTSVRIDDYECSPTTGRAQGEESSARTMRQLQRLGLLQESLRRSTGRPRWTYFELRAD